ncbi:polysaccharide biosynthesis protein [Sphingomonas ginkgonis]|uniref:Polysaccharide biosynthesis protein n=1 Tax=Sphingomonas ginkgonis TaxID=2315330 RepID=A0A429V7W9_9SPHN|nr:ATP-grasp fold amidoligase family protein [Sphingomonas ginkgonis]RST30056.1 polysaccharide biosynthesis protein [Sphingomonas ginkgonis]
MHRSLRHLVRRGEDRVRRLRVLLIFAWRHRRLADLASPTTLTEQVQRRKLEDRNPWLHQLADKLAVKDHVAALLGTRWVTPTLWRGTELPAESAWPLPFVVKSRHGCGHVRVVRDERDYRRARRSARRWMRQRYGAWLDEWGYRDIPRGLLVEPYIGEDERLPVDFKLFVFGGRVRFVQVHLDRAGDHRWIVFDTGWRRVSPASADPDPAPPRTLGQMIEAAERLGAGFDFVRVDLYEVAGRPLFGELTFYPGSGLEPVRPATLDAEMGRLWAEARLLPANGGGEAGALPPPAEASGGSLI